MRLTLRAKLVGLTTVLAGAAALLLLQAASAGASYVQDCKTNSIIRCGAGTPSDFIAKTRANAPGDLPAVYADFGLVSSEYSRFVTTAKSGTLYRDGRIVVGGQTVATDAWSIGRSAKSYSWKKVISGHTYYASRTQDNLLSSSLPVMVMFNSKGQMEFAVMNACGNPTTGKLVTPKYSCDLLQKSAVSGKKDTYRFTTKATATNNAKLAKLVYNFGDGTTATSTSLTKAVEHTYAKPGNYTATVTVYVSLPGNQTVHVTSATCKTAITVAQPKQPFQECVAVTSVLMNREQHTYEFTVTTRQGNGSVLSNASFDFGDGVTAANLAPTTPSSVVVSHSYAKEGAYTTTATVNFSSETGVVAATCQTAIDTGTTPVCQYNPALPPESPDCKPPETPHTLPNTGPAGLVGLFMGTSVLAGVGYRRYLTRRTNL
jgi:PKD repeat protein